jgi:pterin-4a-carbinolamine dehydratase
MQEKLQKATVVLAIIGPAWLTASDQYGRRRLDSPEDWVRLELQTALAQDKDIINVLVGHDVHLPPRHALPDELQELVTFPHIRLRPEVENWTDDIDSIGRRLTAFDLKDNEAGADELPIPSRKKARLPGLSEDQLSQALDDLPGWEPWQDTLAQEYPHERQELRKNFIFGSFREAVEFMAYLAPRFDRINHHPRWSNEWKTVKIRLATWDAHNKITVEDVRTAHEVEQARKEFLARRRSRFVDIQAICRM